MAYLGNSLTVQQYAPQIAYFNGNGSTTAFTLPIAVVTAAQIIVIVGNVPQNPSTAFTVSGTTLTFTSAPPSGTNNIWVEYTSLQTNTIAPSQGTVQDSSFGSITKIPFVSGASIGAGDSSLMKNRIINGAMVIDQRNAGASVTPVNAQYLLDRWQAGLSAASKFSVQQNAGSVTPPVGFTKYLGCTSLSAYSIGAGDTFRIQQAIEGFNIADLGWGTANAKTVTLSFQVYSSLTGTFGGAIYNSAGARSYPFSYSIPVANTWTTISVTIAGDTSGTWATDNSAGIYVTLSLGAGSTYSATAGSWASGFYLSATGATSVVGTSGATFYITGVQLEVGSSATGYEYRQYGQELALCQRYYTKFTTGTSAYCGFGSGIAYNSTTANITFNYPVTMRSTPTASLFSVGLFYGAASLTPVTSISAQYGGLTSSGLQVVATGAVMVAGSAASMIANNSTSAYMDLTAEL